MRVPETYPMAVSLSTGIAQRGPPGDAVGGQRGRYLRNVASYAATRPSPRSASSTFRWLAAHPAVIAAPAGVLPPGGPAGGVRNGAPVPTSSREAGTSRTASADGSSPRRNTRPENET